MDKLLNLEEIKANYITKTKFVKKRIIVCAGTGCVANGSMKVFDALKKHIEAKGLTCLVDLKFEADNCDGIHVSGSGCQGFCQMGPLVAIEPDKILYNKVTEDDVEELVEKTICSGEIVDRLLYKDPSSGELCKGTDDIPFYTRQNRFVLKDCGRIDPGSIEEYISLGGYEAARKALTEMKPEDVCEEVTNSGLRGRGGGGFPTGLKWKFTLQEKNEKKYVICNGDEGDPGAFMDRSIMEGNPHSVIEGMMIAGRAIGADEGYVYVRLEYPLAVQRVKDAVKVAEEMGILGENIFGSGFNFKINVMEGAGAFVCGEETALMASIMGERGMPNPKPPFPAQKGLYDKPTVINNVETLSSVPLIIRLGAKEFNSLGTESSPGTKTFALTGHVANTGLIEVPFGTTLREIVNNIGGGVTGADGKISDEGFKAVQIGGPSGGCLTVDNLDLPLDFDSLRGIGAMVGSGGLVVMNKNTCMVKIAKYFMEFTQNESCGKCVLCREGTKQMLNLLDDITEGRADETTLDTLVQLAHAVQKGSLCGLGKTAPSPVLATIEHFREEYDAHVLHKRCPAKECKSLLVPEIIEDLCKGCGLCARKCPVDAIEGERKQPYTIIEDKCIKCGACIEACKFEAVVG
ncbi:MAG: NADH-ubiquinone oxidoreductase-F iron-sulfur binding region domain-containing protein [Rhodothermaceae bacterium]